MKPALFIFSFSCIFPFLYLRHTYYNFSFWVLCFNCCCWLHYVSRVFVFASIVCTLTQASQCSTIQFDSFISRGWLLSVSFVEVELNEQGLLKAFLAVS
uniref:Uncharacterized protein n=1 Tax=Rhipicephalus microplus TaxID=6941 RepID=A0A6M2DCH1_RHIMP